ncbi:TonB-dependent receptor [Porticoccaceae bacterium]|nr:TonB-dependent receptor [Porticoccaceae bacterium]
MSFKLNAISKVCMMASGFLAVNAFAALTLDEVVVTAQKRTESVQDIPIAISAFSEDELRAIDPQDSTAIIARTPGLTGSRDADTQAVLNIRGVGTNAFAPGADNSVGIYFNDVPISRNIGNQGFMDIARVEVVKGPQGTLFGRNTSSGAISVTNNAADLDESSTALRVSAGNEGQKLYEIISNVAVSDDFALRFSARHDERDGTYSNASNGDEYNGRDHDQFRLSAQWQVSENTNVLWFWEEFEMKNRWQMVDAAGVAASFGIDNNPYNEQINVDPQPEQSIDNSFSVLKVTSDLGDAMTFTSTTGYFDSNIVALPTDADTLPIPIVDFVEPWTISQFSQEFRINGESDKVNWFVGASYYSEDVTVRTDVTIYEDPGLDVLFNDEGLCGLAAEFGLSCGVHNEYNSASNETTSFAIYGDVQYALSEDLSLTVGARWTQDSKDATMVSPLADSTVTALIGVVTGGADNAIFHWTDGAMGDDSWSSLDPRVAIDWRFNEDTLIYANYSKGFKSGGFNRQPIAAGSNQTMGFGPEENNAYEVGIKSELSDTARINAAWFFYDYSDFQLETNQGASILIQNAASLETSGLEVDATFLIGDILDLRIAYAYLDAEFTSGTASFAEMDVDLKGLTPSRAPEQTYSIAGTVHVSDNAKIRIEYSYTDEMFYTANNDALLKTADYRLLSARIDWDSTDGKWGASVIGDNLLGEEYISSMINFLFPMQVPGMGRLMRAEARYNF